VIPSPWNVENFAEAVDDQAIQLVDESKFIRDFAELCQNLGIRSSIYPAYRLSCWFTHPTLRGASLYVTDDGGELRASPATGSDTGLVSMMAHCVLWSRRTVDDLRVDHTEEQFLDGLADRINVVPRLPEPKTPASAEATEDQARG
jgi:hypothetical protein